MGRQLLFVIFRVKINKRTSIGGNTMKNTAHSARQFAFCCVTTVLTALLAVLTFLRPERLPLAPLLVAMLLRPTLLLVTAGVNFSCLKMGVRALFPKARPPYGSSPDRTCLLSCSARRRVPDAPVTAALLLTASAWLDLLEQRLEAGLPDAPPTRMAEAVWAGRASPPQSARRQSGPRLAQGSALCLRGRCVCWPHRRSARSA